MRHPLARQRRVRAVGRLEAEGVLAGRQVQFRLRAAVAKVQVRVVLGDGLPGGQARRVDHDVQVARAIVDGAVTGRLDGEVLGRHQHPDRRGDRRAVARLGEADGRLRRAAAAGQQQRQRQQQPQWGCQRRTRPAKQPRRAQPGQPGDEQPHNQDHRDDVAFAQPIGDSAGNRQPDGQGRSRDGDPRAAVGEAAAQGGPLTAADAETEDEADQQLAVVLRHAGQGFAQEAENGGDQRAAQDAVKEPAPGVHAAPAEGEGLPAADPEAHQRAQRPAADGPGERRANRPL